MTTRSKVGLIILLVAIVIGALLVLRQNPNQNVPLAATTTAPTVATSATLQPTPTATLTEGELAAAAAGTAKYSHYFPTVEECSRAVDNKVVENCVAPDSIKQVTRPEWTQLFSHTDFYVIGLLGRHEVEIYDNSYRRNLVAWQDGQAYSAETFDSLLKANDIVITDTNRELVAKAFVLITLPDYLEQDITFSSLTQGDWPASFGDRFSNSIKVWTEMQGLRMTYLFAFVDGNIWEARRGLEVEYHVGDYIDVPFDQLPIPGFKQYFFQR
jgi:hypothetical protein